METSYRLRNSGTRNSIINKTSKSYRLRNYDEKKSSSSVTGSKFLDGLAYVGTNFLSGIGQIGEGIADLVVGGGAKLFGNDELAERMFGTNAVADWDAEMDAKYDPDNSLTLLGDISSGIGTTVAAMLPALLVPGVGAVGGAVLTGVTAGAGAAGDGVSQAYAQTGELGGKEFGYGLASGVLEGGLEALLGAGAKGVGRIVSRTAKNTAKTAARSVAKSAAKSALKNIGKEMAGEAVEESLQALIDPYLQRGFKINENAQNVSARELGYTALVAALSAGFTGGAAQMVNRVQTQRNGAKLLKSGQEAAVLELAEDYAAKSESLRVQKADAKYLGKLIVRYNEAVSTGESASGKRKYLLGRIAEVNTALSFSPGIEKAYKKIKADPEGYAKQLAAIGMKDISGKTITGETLRKDKAVIRMAAVYEGVGRLLAKESGAEQYRVKGEQATRSRSALRVLIGNAEAELAQTGQISEATRRDIRSAMGSFTGDAERYAEIPVTREFVNELYGTPGIYEADEFLSSPIDATDAKAQAEAIRAAGHGFFREAKEYKKFAETLGVNVAYFADAGPDAVNGYYENGRIYINTLAAKSAHTLAAHEYYHYLKATDTARWSDLTAAMDEYMAVHAEARALYEETVARYASNARTREQGADVWSEEGYVAVLESLTDAGMLNRALKATANSKKTLWERIKGILSGWIAHLTKRKGTLTEVESDLAKARRRIERVLSEKVIEHKARKAGETTVAESMNDGGVRFSISNDKEIKSVKSQLREHGEDLMNMAEVGKINVVQNSMNRAERIAAIKENFKNRFASGVERKGFGFVEITEKQIKNSLNYLKNDGELEAFALVPQVIKKGLLINEESDHKGHGFATFTFAAPVEINGVRGNMGVVVKQTGKYRYKTHRILMPDGRDFAFEYEKQSLETQNVTVTEVNGQGSGISSASSNSISENTEKSTEKAEKDRRYSIRKAVGGREVVVVEDDILAGVPRREWIPTVKAAMKRFGGGIPVAGNLIKVNNATVNEFLNSRNTQFYRATDGTIYQDKLKASGNLDEIVLASDNYINEDLKHERKDKIKEFARGDVLMQIGENKYAAKVIIGFTGGQNMLLYDVIDFVPAFFEIKKDANRAVSGTEGLTPSNDIIRKSGEKSTAKSQKDDVRYALPEVDSDGNEDGNHSSDVGEASARKEAVRYTEELQRITNTAGKIRDELGKKYQPATALADERFSKFLRGIAGVKNWRGQLNKSTTRERITAFGEFYSRENPALADNVNGVVLTAIEFIRSSGNKGELDYDELVAARQVVDGAYHLMKSYDTAWRNDKKISVAETAARAVKEQAELKRSADGGAKMPAALKGIAALVDQQTVMIILDGGNPDGFFTGIGRDLQLGERKAFEIKHRLFKPFDEFDALHKHYRRDVFKQTLEVCGRAMSKEEALYVYLALERAGGAETIERSGLFVTGRNKKGKPKSTEHITGLDAKRMRSDIEAALTDEDREFLKLTRQMYVEAGKIKEETDYKRNGTTNVLSGEYIPFVRSTLHLTSDLYGAKAYEALDRLHGLSFNKRAEGSRELALRAQNIFELNDWYIVNIGRYGGLALTVDALNRVYNARVDANGVKTSLKAVTDNWWGRGEQGKRTSASRHLRGMLDKVQGKTSANEINNVSAWISDKTEKLRGNIAVAALAANFRVMLTQPVSYACALPYIDADCLIKGLKGGFKKSNYVLMDEWSPLALERRRENQAVKAQTLSQKMGKIAQTLCLGMEKTDRLTLASLFDAARYQAEKNGAGKRGTEANLAAARDIFEQALRGTQSNSLAYERSTLQNSTNLLAKSVSMFTTEAVKKLSRLTEAALEVRYLRKAVKAGTATESQKKKYEGAKARFARTAAGIALSNALYAMIVVLTNMLFKRGDKDEEGYTKDAEDWLKDFGIEFAKTALSLFPIIEDMVDYFADGYDMEGFLTGAVTDLFSSASRGVKLIKEATVGGAVSSQDVMGFFKSAMFSLGAVTGYPVRNIYNQMYGLVDRFDASAAYKWKNVFYELSYGADYKRAVMNGEDELAKTILALEMEKAGLAPSDKTLTDAVRLEKEGIDTPAKNIKTLTFGNRIYELTKDERALYNRHTISQRNSELLSITDSWEFKNLNKAQRALLGRKVRNHYARSAKREIIAGRSITVSNNKLATALAKLNLSPARYYALLLVYADASAADARIIRNAMSSRGYTPAQIDFVSGKLFKA